MRLKNSWRLTLAEFLETLNPISYLSYVLKARGLTEELDTVTALAALAFIIAIIGFSLAVALMTRKHDE